MFKQLVSNLPFSPSLITQVNFYAGRLKQETSFRRLGFIFMVLAMFIQMLAVISPPERSLAASDNHIINGLRTRDGILQAWDRPGSDIPAIYGKFGVGRADIAKLPQYPNVTIRSNDGNDWWTIGRNSLSGYSNVSSRFKNTEFAVKSNDGSTVVYMRQLRAWDIRNPYNTYRAWQGTKADGTKFWILKDCGNYTQIGKLKEKRPRLSTRKTVLGNPKTMKPGQQMTFVFEWRNTISDSLAENVVLHDRFNLSLFDIVSPKNLPIKDGQMDYPLGNLGYTPNYKVLKVTVRLKVSLKNNQQVCNTSSLTANNASTVRGGPACVNIKAPPPPAPTPPKPEPCPYNSSLAIENPKCIVNLICSSLNSKIKPGTREVTFTARAVSSNQNFTTVKSYVYDFGDGGGQTKNSSSYTDSVTHSYPTGSFTASVAISYSLKEKDGSSTNGRVVCTAPIDFESEKPVGETKQVKNITQGLEGEEAVNSVVKPGDVLEYTLTTTNSQVYDRPNYTIEDYVGDILDYADLNKQHLANNGGIFDEDTNHVRWTGEMLKANSEITKTFRVKLKDPIPSTNAPSSVSTDFDCKISNRYGTEVGLQVACPAVKGIETLPNTGPGASLIAGFTITTIIGYFFARSRLLAKELDLARTDFGKAGF